jgi:transcription antitermination factor NusG
VSPSRSNNPTGLWYALQIRPGFEKLAARHLSNKGYEQYLPLYSSRRVWSDKIKGQELPLLPGYLFCRFNVLNRLPILVVPGVMSIAGISKIPVAISDEEILSIERVIASGLRYGPWPYVAGQRAGVEQGSLAGIEGTVIRVQSELRLVVSLPLLQRSVCVEIDRDYIDVPAIPLNRAGQRR